MNSATINYAKEIATGLIIYCERWGYDWIDTLKENICPAHFYRTFCRWTRTYFIKIDSIHYHVEFRKDNQVILKRCGQDYDSRQPDTELNIDKVLEEFKR